MRLAVVSDIHANLPALRAVAADPAAERVDGWVCLGDVVGYGPHPNECVEEVRRLGAVAIAGNHDLMAVGALPAAGTPLARQSAAWTSRVLSDTTRREVAGWPGTSTAAGALLGHGSPADPQEYVTEPARAAELLDALPGPCDVLLLGHTHQPWAFARRAGTLRLGRPGAVDLAPADRYLLNPGSVGQSRDRSPDARFLLLDLTRRVAEFRSVRYDIGPVRAALRAAGLPEGSCHIRPARFEPVRRRLARFAR